MTRTRVSTTVDDSLLNQARRIATGTTDSSVIEEALRALIRAHRSAEIDAEYAAAYEAQPLNNPDEWGDLAAFRDAVSR